MGQSSGEGMQHPLGLAVAVGGLELLSDTCGGWGGGVSGVWPTHSPGQKQVPRGATET